MMAFERKGKIFFIRPAVPADIPRVMEIYAEAREFMRRNGNPGQWIDGYPQEEVVRRDLADGHLFVGIGSDEVGEAHRHQGEARFDRPAEGILGAGDLVSGHPASSQPRPAIPQASVLASSSSAPASDPVQPILGVFCHRPGPEPNYARIEDGTWPDDKSYYVLHRIASAPGVHGFAAFAMDWCLQRHPVLRVDTHQDNRPMLHLLSKIGFVRCGIIHVENGTPRIAFQKEVRKI